MSSRKPPLQSLCTFRSLKLVAEATDKSDIISTEQQQDTIEGEESITSDDLIVVLKESLKNFRCHATETCWFGCDRKSRFSRITVSFHKEEEAVAVADWSFPHHDETGTIQTVIFVKIIGEAEELIEALVKSQPDQILLGDIPESLAPYLAVKLAHARLRGLGFEGAMSSEQFLILQQSLQKSNTLEWLGFRDFSNRSLEKAAPFLSVNGLSSAGVSLPHACPSLTTLDLSNSSFWSKTSILFFTAIIEAAPNLQFLSLSGAQFEQEHHLPKLDLTPKSYMSDLSTDGHDEVDDDSLAFSETKDLDDPNVDEKRRSIVKKKVVDDASDISSEGHDLIDDLATRDGDDCSADGTINRRRDKQQLAKDDFKLVVKALHQTKTLQVLNLSKCVLSEPFLDALVAALCTLPTLQELHLQETRLGDMALEELATMLENPACCLETLNLAQLKRMDHVNLSLFSLALTKNTSLRELQIGGNLFFNGLDSLAEALCENINLETLCISSTSTSASKLDLGSLFSRIPMYKGLQQIDVTGNEFTTDVLKTLAISLRILRSQKTNNSQDPTVGDSEILVHECPGMKGLLEQPTFDWEDGQLLYSTPNKLVFYLQ